MCLPALIPVGMAAMSAAGGTAAAAGTAAAGTAAAASTAATTWATALTIASAVAAAGGAVMQHQGQKAQAEYTDKANEIARGQIEMEAGLAQADAERQRQYQYEQAASEVNAYQTEALREQSSLDAMLGELGSGNTASRRLATLSTRQGQDLATITSNARRQQVEASLSEAATVGSIRSKATALRPGERPSKAGLAMTLGSTALQAGTRLQTINNPKPGAGTK